MVLILSSREDKCAARLHDELLRRNVPVWRLAGDEILCRLGVGWRPNAPSESFLEVDSCRVPVSGVTGVFSRSLEVTASESGMTEKDRRFAAFEMQAVLAGLLNEMPGCVVNRPVPGQTYRPAFGLRDNLRHITDAGFRLPETAVTTSVEHAVCTFVGWRAPCWASRITGEPPVLLRPGAEGESILRDLFAERTACLLRQPAGESMEVIVAGDRAYAIDGFTSSDGSRRSVEVDEALRERCARLCRDIGLLFARLSLQRGKGGDTVMDIDPYPDISMCDDGMSTAITCQLADMVGGA